MTTLKLVRVVIRGTGLPNDTATFGDVEYRRENDGPTAIYLTVQKPGWRSNVSYPQRDDDRMKITPMGLPFSRSVGVEFCGSDIDAMVTSAGAQETVAGAVGQIAPLLRYFQDNFAVA